MAWNLKDEAEVKEYLENLGTEYRFGCYHEKKPSVCHLLGDYLEAIKKDWEKAGKVYQVNCDDFNYGHSCKKFADYLFIGKGNLKPDHIRAATYYEKGCELKHAESCLHAGILRTSSESQVPNDHQKAYNYFKTGCELKNGLSCFYLSGMFLSGVKDFMEKDMKKAFEYTSQACELGNIYACANLSQMYEKGDGVEKNEKKAKEYKDIALDLQDQLTKQFRTIKFGEGGA